MSPLLLLALIATEPARPAPPAVPAPAPASAVAQALDLGPALVAHSPATGGTFQGPALAAIFLTGLAAAALLLARRRARGARFVQVLETASVGPRRSLVVARMGDQLLLLGSSEAGITVLSTQPASDEAHAVADATAAQLAPHRLDSSEPPRSPQSRSGLLARLHLKKIQAADPFDDMLIESAEDQELRRKLARGQAGSVR
jgi:flagellar biogenesis protein FliO